MKKKWTVRDKTVFWGILVFFIVLLIPIFMMANYNVPCVDDYNYGNLTHRTWEATGSVWEVLKTAAQQVQITYENWQGTFSAIFLMALQPAIWGDGFYILVPYIMLAALLGGTFFFCYTLFCKIFHATRIQCGIVSLVISAISLQMLPSPSQGFYWYNGSVFYTFFYGISLILYALVILYLKNEKVWQIGYLLGISLLCVLIGGSNYVTSLATVLLFIIGIAVLAVLKNRKWKALLISFFFLGAAFAINVIAPGNHVRKQAGFAYYRPSVPEAVLRSLRYAVSYLDEWITLPLLCLIIFLLPFLWRMASKAAFSFRYPLLVAAVSAAVWAAMFCPPVYAMGSPGATRLLNILFYALVLLIVLNLFYTMGWLQRKLRESCTPEHEEQLKPAHGAARYSGIFLGGILFCFLCSCVLTPDITYTSSSALYSLVSGEAAQYHEEYLQRVSILEDDSQNQVSFPAYTVKPYTLFIADVEKDPDHYRNTYMAAYYDKEQITLQP